MPKNWAAASRAVVYKDVFPELNAAQYLVVEPSKIGPRYEEYKKLYCEIFKHC